MAKTDRTILISNDQAFGQIADPNKLELQITHAFDKIDENDTELQDYKNAEKNITETKLDDDSVSRRTIQSGAVGKDELDPTLWEQTASKAKFNEIDVQLSDIVINVKSFGAKGDGVTDDRAAIQAAIDSIEKGTIFFPKGTYLIKGKYPLGHEHGYPSRLEDGLRIKSNLTFDGNGATLRASENCAFIFDTAIRQPVTNEEQAPKNITIRNLNFEKVTVPFDTPYEFWHLIQVEAVVNLLIENCRFTGWQGDAICLGTLATPDLENWYQTVVNNVRILNCDFDGVNKDNRQAISIVCGKDILIDKCNFKRTTRPGMPGAIDVEPDRFYEYANNIHITNCLFEDIGSPDIVAAVSLVLNTPLDIVPSNFSVKNCTFTNCFRAYKVIGGLSTVEDQLLTGSPTDFEFSGNLIKNCTYGFGIAGVDNVIIRNEKYETSGACGIGSSDYSPKYLPVSRFFLEGNVFKNVTYSSPPFQIAGTITSGRIGNNEFIDCGILNGGTYGLPEVLQTSLTKHKNLTISDNVVLKTGNIPFSAGNITFFNTTSPPVNGNLIVLKNNEFINVSLDSSVPTTSMYHHAKVMGGKINDDTGALSTYTDADGTYLMAKAFHKIVGTPMPEGAIAVFELTVFSDVGYWIGHAYFNHGTTLAIQSVTSSVITLSTNVWGSVVITAGGTNPKFSVKLLAKR